LGCRYLILLNAKRAYILLCVEYSIFMAISLQLKQRNKMAIIATLGPRDSDSFQAAKQYSPDAEIKLFNRIPDALNAFSSGGADIALVPVYNTREGEVKGNFKLIAGMSACYWVDNIVLPIHLSLATMDKSSGNGKTIHTIVGRTSIFRQCSDYLDANYPDATLMAVADIESAISDIVNENKEGYGVIESEDLIKRHGLTLLAREVVAHNRTRFAVLEKEPAPVSGYDATTIITKPLRDQVGLLADILGEFTRRGINIIDLQSENDIKTQKLRIYIEFEGHQGTAVVQEALETIERNVIQEEGAIKILGSFPRVDMRVKHIKSFGFIGSGEMSTWFAERLQSEGYETIVTGRSTPVSPEEMIDKVDVVMVCVPISVTAETILKYGPLIKDGKALVILAGESENTIEAAMRATDPGVEVMFVHNLWGPQALTMKG